MISVMVLIPLVVAAGWWAWATVLAVALCVAIGTRELFAMLQQGGFTPRLGPGLAASLALVAAVALRPFTSFDLVGLTLTLTVSLTLIYEIGPGDRSASLQSWALTVTSALYLGWLLSSFILLRQLAIPLQAGWLEFLAIPAGARWVFLVLAITWLQDTAAFFAGRAFGRHTMAPTLSPKKTWEGFAGGWLASILTALVAVPLLGLPIGYLAAGLIGAIAGIAGPLGDLGESLIKRQIGVKDSGQLIPGHGGLLDRMDSLLFVGPVVYYGVLLVAG
ncbi:MAG: phosphatidate cytidylyltransferase [Candidatus Viridilinea halotolerans]|uniref:Phosphatidate cytidylyltransferase n=1 Tax=Candidatus Viridilinea halotolerans TaxID=2491704 RepID=A0A426TS27_9CHLR|nr:MAG: phosphatidate cytidylyltransferase [Candidatus Viridilinea halotolerans]